MRILLLSDVVMSADGGGVRQTLYNLFSFANPEDILCVAPATQFAGNPNVQPFESSFITYDFEILEIPGNRLGKYLRPFITWFNFSFNNKFRSFKNIRKSIKDFKPDVVVSCPNGPVGIIMHHKLLDGLDIKNIVPYFMDDWMFHQSTLKWVGGSIYHSVRKMLNNDYWLMISEQLADILSERYQVSPKHLLPIHNPVELSNAPEFTPLVKKKHYTLAYAGALWSMHIDSFVAVAKSVKQLKDKLSLDLILYTSAEFWDYRKSILEPLGVLYGGNIPYKEIHSKLAVADVLILCSSFSKDLYNHSKASVQTKITDYLKARKLIVSCGPDYSANHYFLKQNQCGVCIETNDVDLIPSQINNILLNIEDYQIMVNNGWQLLESEYTFAKVHEKLKQFLLNSAAR